MLNENENQEKKELINLYPKHNIDKVLEYIETRYNKVSNQYALAKCILDNDGKKFLK